MHSEQVVSLDYADFGLDFMNGNQMQELWEELEVSDTLLRVFDSPQAPDMGPLLAQHTIKEDAGTEFWSDVVIGRTATEPELNSVHTASFKPEPIEEPLLFPLPMPCPFSEATDLPTAIRPDLLAGPSNELRVQQLEPPTAQIQPAAKLGESGSEHKFVPWMETPPRKPRSKGQKNSTSIACYFCRRRKIRCGGPQPQNNGACKSCLYFKRECVFPTESFRGRRPPSKSLREFEGAHTKKHVQSTSAA